MHASHQPARKVCRRRRMAGRMAARRGLDMDMLFRRRPFAERRRPLIVFLPGFARCTMRAGLMKYEREGLDPSAFVLLLVLERSDIDARIICPARRVCGNAVPVQYG